MATLSAQELRDRAERAIENSTYTQADVARKLDVSRASVNRAINDTTRKFERLRCRIIELLEPYRVNRRRVFDVHPKDQ